MNPIFAQARIAAELTAMLPAAVLLLVALAVAVLLLAAAALLGGHRRREWDHTERMRMIEMGLPVPPQEAPWPRAFVCAAIGAGVPFVAFVSTYFAHQKPGAADELWIAPAVVSLGSVIGASILTGYLFPPARRSTKSDAVLARGTQPGMKAESDPDAYDFVGSRG